MATLAQVIEENWDGVFAKKKIIVTRERLRASINDPKGLLDLVGPSTNALERTKRMELLKNSGISLDDKGGKSFADKLGSAKVQIRHQVGRKFCCGYFAFWDRCVKLSWFPVT